MKQTPNTNKVHLSIPDKVYEHYTNWAKEELEDECNPVNEKSIARKRADIMVELLKKVMNGLTVWSLEDE